MTCPHGHARTPENTYTRRDGRRYCGECERRRQRRNRRALRAPAPLPDEALASAVLDLVAQLKERTAA